MLKTMLVVLILLAVLVNDAEAACKSWRRKKCDNDIRKSSIEGVCTEQKRKCGDCEKCKEFYAATTTTTTTPAPTTTITTACEREKCDDVINQFGAKTACTDKDFLCGGCAECKNLAADVNRRSVLSKLFKRP